MKHRMDVQDRFQHDPQFKALVDSLTHWLMSNPSCTPTELREAAMLAAHRVDMMTIKNRTFDRFGNMIDDERTTS